MLDISAYKLIGWNAVVLPSRFFSVVYENESFRLKFIFSGYTTGILLPARVIISRACNVVWRNQLLPEIFQRIKIRKTELVYICRAVLFKVFLISSDLLYYWRGIRIVEGLDVWMGGGGGGGGVWNSLISKNLAHYSLSLKFLLIL